MIKDYYIYSVRIIELAGDYMSNLLKSRLSIDDLVKVHFLIAHLNKIFYQILSVFHHKCPNEMKIRCIKYYK